jgi:hypothetical protein
MLSLERCEEISKHLIIISNLLTSSGDDKNAIATSDAPKRGRKPGAVSDDVRCEHINGNEQRCKNRATKGNVCGKHTTA